MSFDVLMVVAGLVVGWFGKGSVWNIPNIRLRWIWLMPASYVVQIASIRLFTGAVYEVALVLSYAGLAAFCAVNTQTPGVLWALGGTVSNFLVLSVNGFRMPAYLPVVRLMAPDMVTLLRHGGIGKSIAMTAHTHLNFLADIFYFKVPPPALLSVGDILIAIGIVVLVQSAMKLRKETATVGDTVQTP